MRSGAEVTAGEEEAWTAASAPAPVRAMTSLNAAVPVEESDWTRREGKLTNHRRSCTSHV